MGVVGAVLLKTCWTKGFKSVSGSSESAEVVKWKISAMNI